MSLDFSGSDISESIYAEYPSLISFKQPFEFQIGDLYARDMQNSNNLNRDYSQKSEETQKIYSKHFKGAIDNPINSFVLDLADTIEQELKIAVAKEVSPIEELLKRLDNSSYDMEKLQHRGNEVLYDNRPLKSITFLLSGSLKDNEDAQSYFKNLLEVESKSQSNLFIHFKWEPSTLFNAYLNFKKQLKSLDLSHLNNDLKSSLVQKCENFLKDILESGLLSLQQKAIYSYVRVIILLLRKFSQQVAAAIELLNSIADSIFYDVTETVEKASIISGFLGFQISHLSRYPISVDLMGLGLGTVVITNALKSQRFNVRNIILIEGVVTVEEIKELQPRFEKCVNYFSSSDSVRANLDKYSILGRGGKYAGTNCFDHNSEKLLSKKLNNSFADYQSKINVLYQNAFKKSDHQNENKSMKDTEEAEAQKIDIKKKDQQETNPPFLKIGLGIIGGFLLYKIADKILK